MTEQVLQVPVSVPLPLPEAQENKAVSEKWDFAPSTEIQGPTYGVVPPTRFDYSDVVFPEGRYDSPNQRGQILYAIESPPFVKIGFATEPVARLRQMHTDNPHDLRLLVAYLVPKGLVRLAEAYCHEKLLPFHHRGEWFRADPQVARKVLWTIARKANLARGTRLESVSFAPGRGSLDMSGNPVSIRQLTNLRQRLAKAVPSPCGYPS